MAVPDNLAPYMIDLSPTFDCLLLVVDLLFMAIISVVSGALKLQEEADLTI